MRLARAVEILFVSICSILPIVQVHQPYYKKRRATLKSFSRRQVTLCGTVWNVGNSCLFISQHNVFFGKCSKNCGLCGAAVWFHQCRCANQHIWRYGKFIAFPLHSTGGNVCTENIRNSISLFSVFNRIQFRCNPSGRSSHILIPLHTMKNALNFNIWFFII